MQSLQKCVPKRKDHVRHLDDIFEQLGGILSRLSDADRATVWEGVAFNLAKQKYEDHA